MPYPAITGTHDANAYFTANRRTGGPDYSRPQASQCSASSLSVFPKCSVRAQLKWPESLASYSFRPGLGGVLGARSPGSGEIRAMYRCGPSVLACWAGKAKLILILPPLFLGRRECPYIAALCPSGMLW